MSKTSTHTHIYIYTCTHVPYLLCLAVHCSHVCFVSMCIHTRRITQAYKYKCQLGATSTFPTFKNLEQKTKHFQDMLVFILASLFLAH